MEIREIIDIEKLTSSKKKKNVCAYARVSTSKDVAQLSFNTQVQTYTQYILDNPNWNFIGVYADEGKSGTNLEARSQFKLMIEVARNHMIDLIITKSISRFARNTVDCLSILQELKSWGTEVWFENENISSFDPKIEFVISIFSGMAEEEARNVSENIKWNIRKQFKEGKFYIVTKRFMGYDHDENGNLIINKEEANSIKQIFNMYTSGCSIPKIMDWLESHNIKTTLGIDKWYRGAIFQILKNEKYTGNAILQKTIRPSFKSKRYIKNNKILPKYIVQNSHPAIITQEQFDKAQEIRLARIQKYLKDENKSLKEKFNVRSIYSELFYCPHCGKNYHFKVNNVGKPWAKRQLVCKSNKCKHTCAAETLFCDTVDKQIVNQVNLILTNKEFFLTTLKDTLENDHPVINAKEELKRTRSELEALEARFKAIEKLDDEFSITVINELKNKIRDKQIQKVNLENDLLTKYNVKSFIQKTKILLNPYKSKIKTVDEFPFKELFSKVIVKSRYNIIFVIGKNHDFKDINLDQPGILAGEVDYQIRKTTFTSKHKIIFF
ncbi:recombinase family protein [Mycoplasmatota bacterium]|nr:recombinase family protein [Mycoplasmatota bacterium]